MTRAAIQTRRIGNVAGGFTARLHAVVTAGAIVGDARVIESGSSERGGVLVAHVTITTGGNRRMVFRLTDRTGGGKIAAMATVTTRTRHERMIEYSRYIEIVWRYTMTRAAIQSWRVGNVDCLLPWNASGGKTTVVTLVATHCRDHRMIKHQHGRQVLRWQPMTCIAINARRRRHVSGRFALRDLVVVAACARF